MRIHIALLGCLLAAAASAQETVAAPAEAVARSVEVQPAVSPPAGWARLSAGLGIAGAAIPLGFAAGYTALMYRGAKMPSFMLMGAGLAAPGIGLIPTFGGRSASVSDDLAHKPRLLRIIGWVLIGLSTVSLVTAPAYEAAFNALGWGGNGASVYSAVSGFVEAGIAATGIIFLSVAALMAADRAELTAA